MELIEYRLDLNRMSDPDKSMEQLRRIGEKFPDLVKRLQAAGCRVITFQPRPFINLIPTAISVSGPLTSEEVSKIGLEFSLIYEPTGRKYTFRNGNGKTTAGQ